MYSGTIDIPNETEINSGISHPVLRLKSNAGSMILMCELGNTIELDKIGKEVLIKAKISYLLSSLNMKYLEVNEVIYQDTSLPIQVDTLISHEINNNDDKEEGERNKIGYFSSISGLQMLNGIGRSGYLSCSFLFLYSMSI